MPQQRRRGFTLLEMLIVIGIITFLMTIGVLVYGRMMVGARENATNATILKLHGMLEQRIDSFNRQVSRMNLKRQVAFKQVQLQSLSPAIFGVDENTREVMVKKDLFRLAFPQAIAEVYGFDGAPGRVGVDDDGNGTTDFITPPSGPLDAGVPDPGELGWQGSDDSPIAKALGRAWRAPANNNPVTESSELLFLVLTQSNVYGIAPVDTDEFSGSEIRDTDDDGLQEVHDSWGRPLRFYRWPTRMIRPGGIGNPNSPNPPNRAVASLLFAGLPSQPPSGSGEVDPLNRDPDDPQGLFFANVARMILTDPVIEGLYHTRDTYHSPLIVSPGPDNELGMFEPFDAANAGTLAQPILAGGNSGPLQDNLSNHKKSN